MCDKLGPKCLQISGLHYLTGSDVTFYLYGKGKILALKTLQAGNFPDLDSVLGQLDETEAQLEKTEQSFFCALYGLQPCTSMSEARYQMYTMKTGKILKIMFLLLTERNLYLHILRAHLQTVLAKVAARQTPPNLDITKYGWKIKDGLPVSRIADQPPGPPI